MARKTKVERSGPATPADEERSTLSADDAITVMIELPLRRTGGYASTSLKDLPHRHARALRDLADGLNHDGKTLAGGKRVQNSDDAIAWLCEQLAAASSGANETSE